MAPRTQEADAGVREFSIETVEALVEQARRDLVGDGLNVNDASFVLELDMLYGGQFHVKRALSPRLALHSAEDVQAICEAFKKEFSEAFSPFVVNPEGGVFVESFILKAIVPTQKVVMPEMPLEGPDPAGCAERRAARCTGRTQKDFRMTPIFAYEMRAPRKQRCKVRQLSRGNTRRSSCRRLCIFRLMNAGSGFWKAKPSATSEGELCRFRHWPKNWRG